MRTIGAILVLVVAFASSNVPHAFGEPGPVENEVQADPFGELFGEYLQQQMVAALFRVMDQYLEYLARPQTTERLATFQKSYYDALIKQGFSEEQAFQLVLEFGDPLKDVSMQGK